MAQEEVQYNHYGMPTYDTRNLVIRDDIMGKAKELADMLGTSEEVRQFQQAETKIRDHERIQQLIATIKKKQKRLLLLKASKMWRWSAKLNRKLKICKANWTVFHWLRNSSRARATSTTCFN